MIYDIPSKPTIYAETKFRSRLEARWAAMFDLLGWPYVYEPLDLPWWSPDFLLLGVEAVLVEVKPILSWDADVSAKMENNMDLAGIRGELLLLGLHPFMVREERGTDGRIYGSRCFG